LPTPLKYAASPPNDGRAVHQPLTLEFHQLERRWEHLRVRDLHQHRHLLASLAENGQQTPIVVVAASGGAE